MTKEELKQEAEEYLKRKLKERKNKLVIELPEVYITDLQQAYLAGVESREKRIAELEAQIEKMKCCANCQTVRDAEGNCYLKKDGKCKDKDKWELRR
jgi:hypothetical protein